LAKFSQEKRKFTQIYTRKKKGGDPKNDKICQQQITSSHHQSFLWHFHYYFVPVRVLLKSGALLVPFLDCCLVPHPLLLLICKFLFKKKQTKKGKPGMGLRFGSLSPSCPLIHKVIKKKKADQKGKTWHEIVVVVICQSTKIKQKNGGACCTPQTPLVIVVYKLSTKIFLIKKIVWREGTNFCMLTHLHLQQLTCLDL